MESTLSRKLRARETVIGTWISSGSPTVVDVLRNLRFDWFVLDMEHSPITVETVAAMIQVLNGSRVTPLVRVGEIDQALFKSVLDAGAQGLVVPMVNSAEEAERAVSFCKYPPKGVRGVAAVKASDYGLSMANYIRTANDQITLVVQIETPEALQNTGEILAVDGIDVAFVGPSDMTMTLGLIDDRSNPRVLEAMSSVVKASEAAGKTAGTMATSQEEIRRDLEMGFRFVSVASDVRQLINGAKSMLATAGRT
jgi:2-keto-3-deoxy-L-rhamnonate aldolase RhmA